MFRRPGVFSFDPALVRSRELTRQQIAIVTKRRQSIDHRNHATELGVNAFFGKPYQDTELLREMQSLLKPAGAAVH